MFAWLRIEELDQGPASAAVSGYVVQLINQVTGRANSSSRMAGHRGTCRTVCPGLPPALWAIVDQLADLGCAELCHCWSVIHRLSSLKSSP